MKVCKNADVQKPKISLTLRAEHDIGVAVRDAAWRLRITVQEFMRRAVARELAYNQRPSRSRKEK